MTSKNIPTDNACDCDCCRGRTETFLLREQLARRWKVSPKTLANWVQLNTGPTPIRLAGRLVRYALTDIEAFERSGRAPMAAVHPATTMTTTDTKEN